MLAGAMVRGAFTRISSLATTGAKGLLRMAPKTKMDMESLTLGRMLRNPRVGNFGHNWGLPTVSSMRHMMTIGGFGATPSSATKYVAGAGIVTWSKSNGMQPNHLATDGIGLALHKGRHSNLI